jgi:hypothetical protein
MLVTFSAADGTGEPELEALRVGRELSLLGEVELAELLEGARPHTRSVKRQGLFPEIRAGKKGER